jgi:cytidylate kinase
VSTRDDLRERAHCLELKIAIDGPAGAGKSTVGRGLAEVLGCPYLDTGIMYRAVTLAALHGRVGLADATALAEVAARIRFSWSDEVPGELRVDGSRPIPELRSPEVDTHVSEVSIHPEVRAVLVDRQRKLAASGCVVMVGRDIGTVVLPDAPVKLWITASLEERARRREREQAADPDSVAGRLHRRDQVDSGRPISPAVPAADAVVLGTDRLTPEESVRAAVNQVEAVLGSRQTPAP